MAPRKRQQLEPEIPDSFEMPKLPDIPYLPDIPSPQEVKPLRDRQILPQMPQGSEVSFGSEAPFEPQMPLEAREPLEPWMPAEPQTFESQTSPSPQVFDQPIEPVAFDNEAASSAKDFEEEEGSLAAEDFEEKAAFEPVALVEAEAAFEAEATFEAEAAPEDEARFEEEVAPDLPDQADELPTPQGQPLAPAPLGTFAPVFGPALYCKDLVKSYGPVPALGPVTISLYPGRIVGLLGPNGSGKTTFIKTVAGLLTPTYGEVKICGYKPGVESKSLVSYLPERTYLSNWMKVTDALDYFESFYADFSRTHAIEMLTSLQVPLSTHINKLSKGTKEKVQLILVMARRAKLYLLDEPIAGVDPAAREYILNTIIANYDRSAASVISTHLISDVEDVLDDYLFINRGLVVSAGSVESVYEAGWPSLDAYFREEFRC